MKHLYQCQICQNEFTDAKECEDHESKCEKSFFLQYLYSKDHEGTLENSVIEYIRKLQGDNEFKVDLIDYKNLHRYIELIRERYPEQCPGN